MEHMLGMSDQYVRGQFYTQVQLDRATNSSYLDYEKEIVLPKDEMEHVLSCVYTDIPGELSLPYEVILSYITPESRATSKFFTYKAVSDYYLGEQKNQSMFL